MTSFRLFLCLVVLKAERKPRAFPLPLAVRRIGAGDEMSSQHPTLNISLLPVIEAGGRVSTSHRVREIYLIMKIVFDETL